MRVNGHVLIDMLHNTGLKDTGLRTAGNLQTAMCGLLTARYKLKGIHIFKYNVGELMYYSKECLPNGECPRISGQRKFLGKSIHYLPTAN